VTGRPSQPRTSRSGWSGCWTRTPTATPTTSSGLCRSSSSGTRRTKRSRTRWRGLKLPKVGEKVVPVFNDEELTLLSKTCAGKTFMGRRDKAIIDLFRATGIRLSEPAGIVYEPDKGGNEGDLMEPNGWSSPQMLRRYGASAPQRPSTLHLRPHHGRSIASITNRGAAVLCGPPEPHRRKGQIVAR
jgi:hypothetical protein